MKKLITSILLIVLAITPAMARKKVSTNTNELPQTAQTMLKTYFPKVKVNHIKVEKKSFGGKEYEVVLTNGTEIEFDTKGNWKEVDCGNNTVPSGLINKEIQRYVNANFKGARIVSVEQKKNKYEIKLSNGLEAEFDKTGRFRKLDY